VIPGQIRVERMSAHYRPMLCYTTARLFDATLGRKSSISILLVFLSRRVSSLILALFGTIRDRSNITIDFGNRRSFAIHDSAILGESQFAWLSRILG
jgi:hypothetical protein